MELILEVEEVEGVELDFVQVGDFENTGVFDDAVKGVDAVIHVASVGISSHNNISGL